MIMWDWGYAWPNGPVHDPEPDNIHTLWGEPTQTVAAQEIRQPVPVVRRDGRNWRDRIDHALGWEEIAPIDL